MTEQNEQNELRAERSRRHRESQSLSNLIIALVASLAVVFVIVLIVVRPEPAPREPIDYGMLATKSGSAVELAAPTLPPGWRANAAKFDARPSDGVVNWYIGFVTPSMQFVALRQAIDANPTWLANQLAARSTTGTRTVDGITWQVYDYRAVAGVGNLAYAMTTTGEPSSYILFGTAPDAEFETVASALAPTIAKGK